MSTAQSPGNRSISRGAILKVVAAVALVLLIGYVLSRIAPQPGPPPGAAVTGPGGAGVAGSYPMGGGAPAGGMTGATTSANPAIAPGGAAGTTPNAGPPSLRPEGALEGEITPPAPAATPGPIGAEKVPPAPRPEAAGTPSRTGGR